METLNGLPRLYFPEIWQRTWCKMKDGKIKGKGEGIEAKIISRKSNNVEMQGIMKMSVGRL